jgi:hydrogenase expression/formation protein HypE
MKDMNLTVQLNHGSGGRQTRQLLDDVFIKYFDNPVLDRRDDSARVDTVSARLCFTTDSFVVDPIFFPGGCIGDLAINGTVNDLAVCGGRPLCLSAAFILEEGFPLALLEQIVVAMRQAADRVAVPIVCGDTKVVPRGKCDKIFITTSGIGSLEIAHPLGPDRLLPGDCLILSGTLGDHGMAVLSRREGLAFDSPIESDTASLYPLVRLLAERCGEHLHAMRDPTRGGLAAVLNEFAESSRVAVELDEAALPVTPAVAGACELLGIDPLYVANEGKLVAIVAAEAAKSAVAALREHPLGRQAALIGRVTASHTHGQVSLRTRLGACRLVDMPLGEQLPRIC